VTRTLAACILAAAVAVHAPGAFAAPPKLETAVFAGGCFWTIEHDFELLPGVVKAVSGYSGGTQPRPTYPNHPGYLESVQVTWDPAKTSYARLVNRFWRMIDPTDAAGQVCDQGPSYHTAIFVASPEQRAAAEASLAEIDKGPLKGRIVTQIRPAMPFWPAEDYHQRFATTHFERYSEYRFGCGRDVVLKRIWGADAEPFASEHRKKKP
jgi:peptide-methionine (S)-S-oxide reductase